MIRTSLRVPPELTAAALAGDRVSGYTHNFYRYPARFSPIFAREVIKHFSRPGQVIFDPFMGGGTSIVEALALGRKAIGVDLNTLAHFVSSVKTTPLSVRDTVLLQEWLDDTVKEDRQGIAEPEPPIVNLPNQLQRVWADLMAQADWLPLERQRQFVRCALLKTGQWAIDRKDGIPSASQTVKQFALNMREMLEGLSDFVACCSEQGFKKGSISQNRLLLCRSTAGLDSDPRLEKMPTPSLVVTSPPYPAVHILYHRWQVNGRRETPAPYWLAAQKDGHGASHYTFGSRSVRGLENYFRNVQDTFSSVRRMLARKSLVVQLVAFSDAGSQLPRYLSAMKSAGFQECTDLGESAAVRLWREVPNRKWYCNFGTAQDSAKEVVLFHKPRV